MSCPSCSSPYVDPYGRCSACGWGGGAQPSAYYPVAYTVPSAPTGLALAVQILFGTSLLTSLLFLGLDGYGITLSHSIGVDGAGSHVDAANATFVATSLIFDLTLLLMLGTGITFIVWFAKSANLSAVLAPGRQRLSPGWAVGGWFVPLAGLITQRLMAGDIWRASEPLTPDRVWKPRTPLVTFWWLAFTISQTLFFLPVVPLELLRSDPDVTTRSVSTAWFVVAIVVGVLRIAACVLGILVVRRLTSRQQVRIMQGPGAGHPYSMAAAMQPPVYGTAPAPSAYQPPQDAVPAPAPAPVAEPAVDLAKPTVEPTAEPADATTTEE
ncbi:uncharacterized protein DUF4328 [Streptomyces sp. 846.5]|nr:DUF4328 domain-containing protein [Streptomyces sp. 846.5]TDT95812.1 uncharacterized protein DUF4328 [Streptomyces sp. 846.5]